MAGRRKRKKKADSGPPGAPEWIVTFTDMISLLVTFFVLMMTFSSLETYDALKIDAWLSGNIGVHQTHGFVMPDLPENDLVTVSSIERGAIHPHARPADKLPENIEEMGRKLTEDRVEVAFNTVRDGIKIEFGVETCFEPGGAVVNEALRQNLAELGEVLENYPHLVVIEGHTDGSFEATPTHPTADAMALARARAAAEVLLAQSNMNRHLLQVAGHGDRVPRAENFSVGGRRLNRRIQVRVLALSKQRATYLSAQKAEEAR